MTDVWATAGIEVTTAYSPLAFALAIVRPQLQLDGYAPTGWGWGTQVMPVRPGRHQLRCWFRWGLFSAAGSATTEVDVPDGAVVRLRYQAPTWFVFSPGRWTQIGTAAGFGQQGGWHPDPGGRHRLRYWDGSAWTRHVSDGVAVSVDGEQ